MIYTADILPGGKESPLSKYHVLLDQVRHEIQAGEHGRAGDRFMPTRRFAQVLGVSLATAQKIHRQLQHEGLLVPDATNPAIISAQGVRQSHAGPRRLGLVVTHIASPFFSNLAQHVQAAAQVAGQVAGHQVLVGSSEHDFSRERELIDSFRDMGVEALLVAPGLDPRCAELYRRLIDTGTPLVMLGRRLEAVPCDFVAARNGAGGAAVARHLIDLGFDRFGYIAFGPRLVRDERLEGYRDALRQAGHDLPASHITDGDGWDIGHGESAMARLAARGPLPRAMFAFNDLLAIGALRYCRQHGIDVPGEVAIAGFDNLAEARVTAPALTSVEYPVQAMARLAVQCALEKLQGQSSAAFNRILLEPRLVVRASTDAHWQYELTRTPDYVGQAYEAI